VVKLRSNIEAPGALAVWRTWYAAAFAGTAGILLATSILLWGWVQHQESLATQSAQARLRAVGEAIVGSDTPDALDPSRLERAAQSVPGVHSIMVMQSPALASNAGPGRVLTSLPLGSGEGFLVLEGEIVEKPELSAMLTPALGGVLIAAGAAGIGLWFARRTAAIRRVASALAALERGETQGDMLTIAERFGGEAAVWNSLITRAATESASGSDASADDRREQHIPGGDISTSTLDAIPYGLVGLDRAGRVLFCNGAAAAMLGVNRKEVIGERYDTVDTLGGLSGDIERVSDGDSPRASAEFDRETDGNSHTLRVGIRGLRKTDGAHVLVLIEDVTQQRLTEAARDSFVAQATHELRTPLTNIKLAAEEAIDAVSTDPATVSMSLNIVNQEARRLERVVTDMLSVSEMEAASMSLKIDDVSPAKLLEDLQSDYQNQARERNIEFTVNRPPKLEVVFGDREKIGLLLHNIVGNAMKYTPDGGAVTITATQDAMDWRVEVRDTGPGIAPDEQEKVFEKFYRASNAKTSDVVGTGLGLALAAEIARLHDGEITLQSELGEGCTFTVRLPRGIQSPGQARAA